MQPESKKESKILIAGAGPVGLSAAIFLSSLPEVSLQIVEKKTEQTPLIQSKALGINPRTLEMFEGFPIQQRLLKESIRADKMRISTKHKVIIENSFQEGIKETKFPFISIYPQSYTERLFEEYLNQVGHKVKRGVEVQSVKNIQNGVLVKFKDNDEEYLYDYVIGSDGARSTIRKQLNFTFEGQTWQQKMYIFDTENKGDQVIGQIIIDNPRIFLILPVKDNIVRLITNSQTFDDLIPQNYNFSKEYIWESSFNVNNRHVDVMNKGRVYLMGDAAHVHAPIGGRGMNMGIEDAFVFFNMFKQGKLQQYSPSRIQRIHAFVTQVNSLSSIMTMQKSLVKSLIPWFGPLLNWFTRKSNMKFLLGIDHETPYLKPKI